MSGGEKVFSEQEASEIVRRAVEFQEQGQDPPYTPGITLEELHRIANEIGVDPKHIERAIREARRPDGKVGPFNFTEEFERVVVGELGQEDFDVLLEHLKPGLQGQAVAQVGRTLRGQTKSGPISTANVHITSRNGRTKINVRSSPLLAFLIGLHPALIGTLVSVAALSEQGLWAPAVAVSVGLLSSGWFAFRKLVGLGHRKARELADKLETRVAEETQSRAATTGSEVSGEETTELRQGL